MATTVAETVATTAATDWRVREVQRGLPDAERLADLFNRSNDGWPGGVNGGVPETAAHKRDSLQRSDAEAIYLVERDGEALGYGDLHRQRGRDDVAYLGLLNVRPDWHSQGLGKALILTILERTRALGCTRLDLGTWPGNLRAVPLYKKTGFMWVPDTTVHMENYIPLLLAMPAGRAFFEQHDWYRHQVRELTVAPDEHWWHGVKVFPYRFEADGSMFAAWIDRQAETVTAIETDDFALACHVGQEEVVCGIEHPITWELVNKQPERGPLTVSLLAEGDAGVAVSVTEAVTVTDTLTLSRPFTIAPDIERRPQGLPAPQILSTLIVNGLPVRLGTAVKPVQAVEIGVHAGSLIADKPDQEVTFTLRNRLDRPVQGELRLDPQPHLAFDRQALPVTLEPLSWAEATVRVRPEAGAHDTRARVVLPAEGLTTRAQRLTLATRPLHGAYAWEDAEHERVVIEAPELRLLVDRRGGALNLQARDHGQLLHGPAPSVGPPFVRWHRVPPRYDVRVTEQAGAVTLTLVMPQAHLPEVTLERTITLGGGSVLRLDHRVVNTGDTARQLDLSFPLWSQVTGTLVVPLRDGLLREPSADWGSWPAGSEDLSRQPEAYAEGWLALEGTLGATDDWVLGMVLPEVKERQSDGFTLTVPELGPQAQVALPPLHLFVGRGDWRAVRNLWRALEQPAGVREELPPQPRPVLEAGFEPAPLVVAATHVEATLAVHNRRGKQLSGAWRLATETWHAEPDHGALTEVDHTQPARVPVRLTTTDSTPRVETARVKVDEPATDRTFEAPIVLLGDAAADVRVTEAGELWRVDNGRLAFEVAASFRGLVSLTAGDRRLLLSAWPTPRARSFMNPWFGGAHAFVNWPGDRATLAGDWRAEPVGRAGERGLTWSGVRLTGDLTHKDWRWLRLETDCLTLGDSNVVAVVQRWINRGNGRFWPSGGLAVQPAFGPAADPAEPPAPVLHYDELRPGEAARTWTRTPRLRRPDAHGMQAPGGTWAAAEDPTTGQTLALINGDPRASVQAQFERELGVALLSAGSVELRAGETADRLAWLVAAPSRADAERYRALEAVWQLP